jgi:hypothetical protein
MPYIGKNPVGGGFHKLDSLTASATDTYALTLGSAAYYPESANQLLVSLNGVIQAPQDSFTVSGSDLVFDDPLTGSDSIDFVVALGDVLAVKTVTDGAVTTNKIGNGAVTSAKLDTNIAVSGNLDVGTIRDAAGTNTAMTIDSSGIVKRNVIPSFQVRGRAGSTSLTAAETNFDYITSWTTTDFDTGGLLNAGGYAEIPAGKAGLYQVYYSTSSSGSANYKTAWLFWYDTSTSTYNHLCRDYSANDYDGYTTGGNFILELDVGDRIYAGYDDRYSVPSSSNFYSRFSMYLIG